MPAICCCTCVPAGAAFLGTQLLTVGQDGNIAVWNMHASSATSSASADDDAQLHRQRMQHPDLNVTMRSWLERPQPAATGKQLESPMGHGNAVAAATDAKGVLLPELQACEVDPGTSPSVGECFDICQLSVKCALASCKGSSVCCRLHTAVVHRRHCRLQRLPCTCK
jgi:hypothetical protein